MGFACSRGFQTRGDVHNLIAHIKGSHSVDVKKSGEHRIAHCNEDYRGRQNCHGRRINSVYGL